MINLTYTCLFEIIFSTQLPKQKSLKCIKIHIWDYKLQKSENILNLEKNLK